LKIGNNKTFGAQSATVKNINSDISEIYVGVPSKILNK
jgi:serine acetyltransferase